MKDINCLDEVLHQTHTMMASRQNKGMEVLFMSKRGKNKLTDGMSDEQAVRGKLSKEFDHEFANEPLTPEEKFNNKKTKKRQ